MEEKGKKLNFWKKIYHSVFKVENYSEYLIEKKSSAIKYLLLLIFVVTIIVSIFETVIFAKMLNKGYKYFANELPNFEYKDEKLKFSEEVKAYDEEYKFYFIVNTDENITQEKIKEYKNEIYNTSNGVLVLNNKAIYVIPGTEIEYEIKDIFSQLGLSENINNKQELIDKYNENGSMPFIITYFIVCLLQMYIINLITIFMDVIVLAIFGIIAAAICGMKVKFAQMFNIAVHAITLPVIITGTYTIILELTGFVIKYYNIMYLLISYVYIVAAILMIKSDLIKQKEELIKIEKVQEEVRKELEEKESEEENKDKQEKKDKDNDKEENEEKEKGPDINAEPDGSEI